MAITAVRLLINALLNGQRLCINSLVRLIALFLSPSPLMSNSLLEEWIVDSGCPVDGQQLTVLLHVPELFTLKSKLTISRLAA